MNILNLCVEKIVGYIPVIAVGCITLVGLALLLICALFIHPAIFFAVIALLICCFLPEKKL